MTKEIVLSQDQLISSGTNGNGDHPEIATSYALDRSHTVKPEDSSNERRMPPVRLSTYDNSDGNGLERMLPYLDALAGKRGRAFIEAARQGRLTDDELNIKDENGHKLTRGDLWRKKIDREIYKGIRREFDLPDQNDDETGKFYKKSLQVANEARTDAQETLFPGHPDVLNLLNEIGNTTTQPHMLVEYAAIAETPRLRQELQTQAATAMVAAHVLKRTETSKTADIRAEVQRLLGKKLFKAPVGSTERVATYTQHDDVTNEVVWVQDVDQPEQQRQEGVHWRLAVQDMRPVEDLGMVETNIHDKLPYVAVQKAIRRAQENKKNGKGDIIDPNAINSDGFREVDDYYGMKFILKAPNNSEEVKVSELRDKVIGIISKHFGMRLDKNVPKDKNGANYNGQSKKVKYKRNLLGFSGEDIPLELMFESERYHINTQTDVGTFDESKGPFGEYNGLEHEVIYKPQRLLAIQPLLIPNVDPDLTKDAVEKQHEKVEELKEKGRVKPPEHIIFKVES